MVGLGPAGRIASGAGGRGAKPPALLGHAADAVGTARRPGRGRVSGWGRGREAPVALGRPPAEGAEHPPSPGACQGPRRSPRRACCS